MNSQHVNHGSDRENPASLILSSPGFASAIDLIGYISNHVFIVIYLFIYKFQILCIGK